MKMGVYVSVDMRLTFLLGTLARAKTLNKIVIVIKCIEVKLRSFINVYALPLGNNWKSSNKVLSDYHSCPETSTWL